MQVINCGLGYNDGSGDLLRDVMKKNFIQAIRPRIVNHGTTTY